MAAWAPTGLVHHSAVSNHFPSYAANFPAEEKHNEAGSEIAHGESSPDGRGDPSIESWTNSSTEHRGSESAYAVKAIDPQLGWQRRSIG